MHPNPQQKTPTRAFAGRREGVKLQLPSKALACCKISQATNLRNAFLAVDIRRRGKVCPFTFNGKLANTFQSIRYGGTHTLLRQPEGFWLSIDGLRSMGLRIRIKPMRLGGRRYHHVWLMEKVQGVVEVECSAIIKLRPPPEGRSKNGARFVWEFEKHRHFWGPDASSKLIALVTENGGSRWVSTDVATDNPRAIEAVELHKQGLNQRQIAERLGCSLGSVNAYLKEAA